MRFSQINSINNNNLRVCSCCMCKHCLIIIIMKKMAPTISVSLHFVLNQRAPKKWTEFVLWNYRIVVEFMGMDLLIFPVVSDSKKKKCMDFWVGCERRTNAQLIFLLQNGMAHFFLRFFSMVKEKKYYEEKNTHLSK